MTDSPNAPPTPDSDGRAADRAPARSFGSRLGSIAVVFALVCALSSFFVLSGLTPLAITDRIATILFALDLLALLILLVLVVREGWSLVSARRAGAAASNLHLRIVRVFALIAAAPAIVIAIVGTLTLDRAMNPAFMQDVRSFIFNTAEAARLFGQSQCRSLLQEASLTASDLDRAKPMYDADRRLFHEFFSSRARFLGFTSAALMREDGQVLEQSEFRLEGQPKTAIEKPEASDFEEARKAEPTCIVRDEGRYFVALRPVAAFPGAYLYVARPVDPFTTQFPQQAASLIAVYNGFEAHRRTVIIAFAALFGLLSLVMLLAAMFWGLNFANRLVAPIRRLIAATDQVSAGNLYVRVPIDARDGDLSHLGETFNKMTTELRLQQNRLIAASQLIDDRRVFTEAVLSGVPVAVMGVDRKGLVTVVNPSAEQLAIGGEGESVGRPLADVLPEIDPILQDAASHGRPSQAQLAVMRGGRERILNVRVTTGASDASGRSYVVTMDDITELVTAQRTSAWADVARRIAHEIKNPLTPIQLSAERLKRKYGRTITHDREVFDQCTDTIVRQVDDIKRMVDEFSSFARMPKARPERDDLTACVKQVLFLLRVGHADIRFVEDYEHEAMPARFDRRLLSQAVANVVKNAAEGVAAGEGANGPGQIYVRLSTADGFAIIDVVDNGRGFPTENRQRLLEPYVTTRAEGTGLGLPIVAKIMEEHGGGIELLDAPDGPGAHVRLYLKLGLETDEARALPHDEASDAASGSRNA